MKILLTGSDGFLGSVLMPMLQEKHEVVPFDNGLYSTRSDKDIRNLKQLKESAKDCDVLIALGGVVGDVACDYDRKYTESTNVEATHHLKAFKDKRIIFASSCSVYGFQEDIVDETSKLNPVSYYAETKIESEHILFDMPDCCILRFPTLYGLSPRMRYDLVVNKFVLDAVTKKKVTVHGGSQWRPFCSVKDVAKGIVKLVDRPEIKGTYNMGGTNYSLLEVAWKIREQFPCDVIVDRNITDARSYEVSFDKIEKELGLIANQTMSNAIQEIVPTIKDFVDDDKYYNALAIKRNVK
jgi:nucleoside-diphosphate-sugar epimerase